MYEIDKEPNSDEAICENCGMIIDEKRLGITADFENGCSECMSYCQRCGKYYFTDDMYLCSYFGRICNDCLNADNYKKDLSDKVIKEALRCYFDETECQKTEKTIIKVAEIMGFTELANEMKNDLK